ncbi:hypothetical protein ON010_g6778 [Phytophthora cinnamomi]|nr:hypothetical protein ON010_g6778 [Phytophthora cinnamomi]
MNSLIAYALKRREKIEPAPTAEAKRIAVAQAMEAERVAAARSREEKRHKLKRNEDRGNQKEGGHNAVKQQLRAAGPAAKEATGLLLLRLKSIKVSGPLT